MKTRDFINTFKTTKIMKTGGTMNFLKRAGAILMVVAIFASSCNKYADDFKQLNTKLDALATQVAGVTQLSTDMAAVKSSVAAVQTAIAALPNPTASIATLTTNLAAVSTKIDGLTTQLGNLATAGTATKAVVDQLKLDLAALAAKTAADDAALTLQLNGLAATDVTQSASLATAIANQATLAASIAAAQTSLNNLTTLDNTLATSAAVAALQVLVQGQKAALDQILLNTSMYNGDVTITTDAEVTFFLAKIAQLGIVNGNLTIDQSLISAGQLPSVAVITSKIMNVIGTGIVTVNFKQGDAIDLSKLVSCKGAMTVTGTAKGAGADINLSSLSSVGGNLTLSYDGPYVSSTLKNVGGSLYLVNKAVVAATTPLGTTDINIPGVAVTGSVYDAVPGVAGVVTYPLAADVILAGGVSSVTAAKATVIKLGATTYGAAGLTVSASATAAATIDLSAATNITGAASITGFGATAVNLSGLVTAPAGLTVITGATGTVDLTKFNEPVGTLTVTGPKTLVLPALAAGTVVSTTATTANFAKLDWAIPATLPAVTTLTLGAVANNVALAGYTTVVTVDITGKTVATIPQPAVLGGVTATVADAALTTVKLGTGGGTLGVVSLNAVPALVSVTTAGVLNSFTLNACNALTSAALVMGHTHYIGGVGSTLAITNNTNAAFTSIKSSVDYPAFITVTGNTSLTSFDLSSYVTKLLAVAGAATNISISGNAVAGAYTNAIAATPTTPYVETTITSASLHTLKAFVAAHTAAPPALTMAIDLDAVKIGAGAASLLSVKMKADTDAKAAYLLAPAGTMGVDDAGVWPAATAGIDVPTEMAHVL